MPCAAGGLDAGLPEPRLADPGLAREHEPPREPLPEEAAERGELRLAPDDRRRPAGSLRALSRSLLRVTVRIIADGGRFLHRPPRLEAPARYYSAGVCEAF